MVVDALDEEDNENVAIMVNGVMTVARDGDVINTMESMRLVRGVVRLRSHSSMEADLGEVEDEEDMRTQRESSKNGHDHQGGGG